VARELTAVHIPIVAVLGNHDYESGKCDEVRQILVDAGVTVLDGDTCEVQGIGNRRSERMSAAGLVNTRLACGENP